MAVHFVTGKLGGGKSLVAVGKIRDYLLAGKKVATNLDLNLEHLLPVGYKGKCEAYRIPDKPNADDLFAVGCGTKSKRDEDFGLLVLDELGTWMNSRDYQKDKSRKGVIDYFLHSRKFGWDVILIVQDPELIDKQLRISLGEHTCICRRTDRIPIPFVSFLLKILTGWKLKLPRIHVGSVFYGSGAGAIKVDTWIYRGNFLFRCYDTNQVFFDSPNRISQYLPPSKLKPLNLALRNVRFYMRLTKIYYKRFRVPFVFLTGLTCNFVLLFLFSIYTGGAAAEDSPEQITESVENIVPAAPPEKEKETTSVLLSFVESSNNKGGLGITYFYNGEMFTFDDSPYDIKFRGGKPYIEVEVKEEENGKS